MSTRSCRECQFWDGGANPDEADEGLCRRTPPQLGPVVELKAFAVWPTTDPDDWCGEFKANHAQFVRQPPAPAAPGPPPVGADGAQ